ncbi:phage upper tail fiber protein [Shewanella algae]|uniref:phage upper tail fiber protein n=1 Tax=Shewanella algae TaxID=38313 RepID=UPI001AACAC71|nr:hypothetical protein [Shewanella algae]QTE84360.1 hypothetical protein JKK46_11195 [Shewanella algae]QTE84369.1 hypothetical protein JKK46_11240 [Shewanella algae]
MANCVEFDPNGYLVQSASGVCDLVVMTQAEYDALSVENIIGLMQHYFEFDVALASQLSAWYCVTFIGAHALGRMVKLMGKQ